MVTPTHASRLFCAETAKRIGLEEAIFFEYLKDAAQFSLDGHTQLSTDLLEARFPFWQIRDFHRLAQSLKNQHVIEITSAPIHQEGILSFTLSTQHHKATPSAPTATASKPSTQKTRAQGGAIKLSPRWRPDQAILDKLYQDHGIIAKFAEQQVSEFVQYWVDSNKVNHSWPAQFYKHVVRNWQRQKSEVRFLDDAKTKATSMQQGWYPHHDAIEILTRSGIKKEFIEDAIPEFVLYWRERGAIAETWNSNFIKHVKKQWAIFIGTMKHDTLPKPMPSNWQPSNEVYDILALAHINKAFAQNCIKEFVLYWQETKRLHNSWNTKFLQHVKYQWANQLTTQGNPNAQAARSPQGQQPASWLDKHTDRSWADGL
ncbi:MAG: DnaT-like ssDNA-binding domain-containing protein [Cellvibrionales bacterium]|nr:DnaT-like ssDNA-binding domain-containing protein [Cellvibrionales bacterium]